MGDVVSDGESFSCPFCTDKVKLGVSSSPIESDSKKLANTSNHSFSAPGAQCIVIPSAPKPCQPNAQNILPGQSPLTIDGSSALGAGCKFMCANGGLLAVSASAQSSTIHDGAAAAEAAAALAASSIVIDSATTDEKQEKADNEEEKTANDEEKRQAMNKEYGDDFEKPIMKDRKDGTPRQREVYQRKDIDWDYKRPDGLTNREAAKEGLAPQRIRPDGKKDTVELHHHRQDKDGPLVELWSSKHRKVEHDAPRPGWRVQHKDEAAKFCKEKEKHWKWRANGL